MKTDNITRHVISTRQEDYYLVKKADNNCWYWRSFVTNVSYITNMMDDRIDNSIDAGLFKEVSEEEINLLKKLNRL